VNLIAIQQLLGFLPKKNPPRILHRGAPRLALGRQHLLEHRLQLHIHLHSRVAEDADGRRPLLHLKLDLPIFQLPGLELLAQLLARAPALFLRLFVAVIDALVWPSSTSMSRSSTCASAGSFTASVISWRTSAIAESSRSRIMLSTSRPW